MEFTLVEPVHLGGERMMQAVAMIFLQPMVRPIPKASIWFFCLKRCFTK